MTVDLAPEPTPVEIATDLQHSLLSLKSVVSICNLLDGGTYSYRTAHAVPAAIQFMTALYNDLKEACLTHADADKVPELVELKAKEAKVE